MNNEDRQPTLYTKIFQTSLLSAIFGAVLSLVAISRSLIELRDDYRKVHAAELNRITVEKDTHK